MSALRFGVSTTAFRGRSLDEAVVAAVEHQFTLEFSSGLPFEPGLREKYLTAPCSRLPHNYFPAPAEPFVLNLASADPKILSLSQRHCEQGLALAAESGAGFYSVHAGFCVDAAPEDLGRQLAAPIVRAREEHWRIFLDSVRLLTAHARALGVSLLIENNVLSALNLRSNRVNPVLCADPAEIGALIDAMASPAFGILLDTGHWKVTSATLGFPLLPVLAGYELHVRAVHHSDNNGVTDDNRELGAAYWFLPEMPRFAHALHVLEVNDQPIRSILRQRSLLSRSLS